MPLPNFLIIGAQKSGTSWLAYNLRQHPEVFIPDYEIHFFDKYSIYAKGISWYEEHFASVTNEKAIGEKTPDYLWVNPNGTGGFIPDPHRRIHETLPEAKLIIVLRNPVERAISAVNHLIGTGRVSPLHSIDDLLIGKKRALVEGHGVIAKGRYYRQIRAYLELFNSDQMLILVFEEDVVQNPASGLEQVCRFLRIDPLFEFPDKKKRLHVSNPSKLILTLKYYLPFSRPFNWMSKYMPKAKFYPSESTITALYSLYEEENEKLFNLIQRRPPSWLKQRVAEGYRID